MKKTFLNFQGFLKKITMSFYERRLKGSVIFKLFNTISNRSRIFLRKSFPLKKYVAFFFGECMSYGVKSALKTACKFMVRRIISLVIYAYRWVIYGKAGRATRHEMKDFMEISKNIDLVVICNVYPVKNRYGGEFVRSRVEAYARNGFSVLVVEVNALNPMAGVSRSENVWIARVDLFFLENKFDFSYFKSARFLSHAAGRPILSSIVRHVEKKQIFLWFHGSDVRDYRRLFFNYDTHCMEKNRAALDKNRADYRVIAKEVFEEKEIKKIFVSRYLRQIAENDVGVNAINSKIIPNYIDCDFYEYQGKSDEFREKILLIRCFKSKTYANDVAIEAIEMMSSMPGFDRLNFFICGFGQLFSTLTKNLEKFQNIVLHKGHLSRDQMKKLHSQHGVFLAPTRHDTQGVTMCEAMSSGLVCVTNRVAAIPEYAKKHCAMLVRPDDPKAFADAIWELQENPKKWSAMSKAAGEYVRRRCGYQKTIAPELKFIFQSENSESVKREHPNFSWVVLSESRYFNLPFSSASPVFHCLVKGNEITISSGDLVVSRSFSILSRGVDLSALFGLHALSGLKKIMQWFSEVVTGDLMFLVEFEHLMCDFVLYAASQGFCRYAVMINKNITAIKSNDYPFLNNAKMILFRNSEVEKTFHEKYVGVYSPWRMTSGLTGFVTGGPIAPSRAIDIRIGKESENKKRLLIVAYFSGDCRCVGVQRVNYWFNMLECISSDSLDVHLATAFDWGAQSEKIHYIPDYGVASMIDPDHAVHAWQKAYIATEQRNSLNFNTLSHYWRIALEKYFDKQSLRFDVVLISGNPFSCFDFAAYAKRRWHSRVILDYRDPFSNNPRMKFSKKAREYARFVEKGYNFQADFLVSVNEESVGRLELPGDVPFGVVENGFDERHVKFPKRKFLQKEYVNFVHAGSFRSNVPPHAFINALDSSKFKFHHIGFKNGVEDLFLSNSSLVLHGRMGYDETLEMIGSADCGVVFVSETGFETTTKVYDYLAMGIDILICTAGPIQGGALGKMLTDVENVYWCRNNEKDLSEFMGSYVPSGKKRDRSYAQYERFSRKESAKKLINVIERLLD